MKLILIILLFFGIVCAEGTPAVSEDDPITEVNALIDNENFPEAVTMLKGLVAEDDTNPDYYNLLAYSLRNLEQYDSALEHYQRALFLDPEHVGALEYLGELYLQTDKLELAQAQLKELETVETCLAACSEYEELADAIEAYKTTGETSW